VSTPDSNRGLVGRALAGAARAAVRRPRELRYHVIRDVWSVTKRFGAARIDNIQRSEISGVQDAVIEGYIDDPNRAVLAALCQALGARTFFEIGTNRGRTAWTVARNNPEIEVYTLDLPSRESLADVTLDLNESDRAFFARDWDRGSAYAGTPEADRIHTLLGDSATFDYSPYEGKMDVVFVDGAHTYSYVRNDTEKATRMLTPDGTIAWDDYPSIPGVYRFLTEWSEQTARPLYHVLGTRLVISPGKAIVESRPDAERFGHVEVA
jgi:predicted O-methyltransferase YrrM